MSKKFKAVLFDYDGTLIDTNQLIVDSWNHMYKKHFGGTLTGDDVKWTFGMLLSDAVDEQMKRMGHSGYDLAEIVESYREFQRGENATPAPPFEGMPELIAQLKERGVLLGIVTSRAQETLMKGLEKYGLKDSFGFIVCAETTQIHKPRPEPALICCKGLGVAPQDALIVGDSVFDPRQGILIAGGTDQAVVGIRVRGIEGDLHAVQLCLSQLFAVVWSQTDPVGV